MDDRPIQLDASFDQRATYTVLVWLRPRDATVTIGEPVAVVIDGTIQRVISAPCSGRIVTILADAGAPLLPRAIIGMIRPSIPLPEILRRSPLGAIAAGVVLLTIGLVSLGNALPSDTRISLAPNASAPVATPTLVPATPGEEAAATALPAIDSAATPTPEALLDQTAPTPTVENPLPEQPTQDPDPFGTGVDSAAVYRDTINKSRQLMTMALEGQQFFTIGPVDSNLWANEIEPRYTRMTGLQSEINTALDPVLATIPDAAQRDFLTLLSEQHIVTCIEPYRLVDDAQRNSVDAPDTSDTFILCKQYLEALPNMD